MRPVVEFSPIDDPLQTTTNAVDESLDHDDNISNTKHSFIKKNKKYIVVIACMAIQLASAWHAVFGNYLPYLSSLITSKNVDISNDDESYIQDRYSYYTDQISWTYSIWVIVYSLTMGVGGKMEYKYGPKLTICLASLCIILGLFFTYLVLEFTSSPYLLYFSYGVMLGGGAGLLFTTPYIIGMRWFEHVNRKGLVSSFIFSGISISSMLFNLLSTEFVNPDNIPIDQNIGFIKQQSVLDNVPTSFLTFIILCFCLLLFGIIFIENPPNYNGKDIDTKKRKKKSSIYSDYDMKSNFNEYESDKQSLLTKNDNKKQNIQSIICQTRFWNLFFTILVLPVTYVYSQWKEFNNKYLEIENDQILAIMASTSNISEGISRIFWGYMFDKLESKNKSAYKIIMCFVSIGLIIFIVSWTQLKLIEDNNVLILFAFIWLIVLYVLLSGALTLLPIQTAHIYGTKKGGIVYGLLYCARIGGTLFSMTAVIETRQLLGWFYMNNFWVGTQIVLFLLVITSKS